MMDMDTTNFLGMTAGTLTTVAFVPQVLKTWRTRSARDVSLAMFLIFSLGVVLWILYGVIIGAMPVIIANSITLALALLILFMKARFRE
jgi:MtN3 and saliva related transmembrane protein